MGPGPASRARSARFFCKGPESKRLASAGHVVCHSSSARLPQPRAALRARTNVRGCAAIKLHSQSPAAGAADLLARPPGQPCAAPSLPPPARAILAGKGQQGPLLLSSQAWRRADTGVSAGEGSGCSCPGLRAGVGGLLLPGLPEAGLPAGVRTAAGGLGGPAGDPGRGLTWRRWTSPSPPWDLPPPRTLQAQCSTVSASPCQTADEAPLTQHRLQAAGSQDEDKVGPRLGSRRAGGRAFRGPTLASETARAAAGTRWALGSLALPTAAPASQAGRGRPPPRGQEPIRGHRPGPVHGARLAGRVTDVGDVGGQRTYLAMR